MDYLNWLISVDELPCTGRMNVAIGNGYKVHSVAKVVNEPHSFHVSRSNDENLINSIASFCTLSSYYINIIYYWTNSQQVLMVKVCLNLSLSSRITEDEAGGLFRPHLYVQYI